MTRPERTAESLQKIPSVVSIYIPVVDATLTPVMGDPLPGGSALPGMLSLRQGVTPCSARLVALCS